MMREKELAYFREWEKQEDSVSCCHFLLYAEYFSHSHNI